ncbi:MAG: hypothetical protein LW832_00195 [Parachlamydia sp.]|jgi:menaquinone-specific isochorismate synthase|nr:hypothetical protein [Parachlamydia sp.]
MDLQKLFLNGSIASLNQKRVLLGFGKKELKNEKELDPGQPAFYFPDFFLEESRPWLQYDYSIDIANETLLAFLEHEPIVPPLWEMNDFPRFSEGFNALQHLFATSDLKKGVPYAFATSSCVVTVAHLKKILKKALFYAKQFPLQLYGSWNMGEGFIGLTPETLFLHTNSNPSLLTTAALAGTRGNEQNFSPKDEQEHAFVIEGMK